MSAGLFSLLPFILLIGVWAGLMRFQRYAGGPQNALLQKLDEIQQGLGEIREELRRQRF